jgi:hypothetical protein
LVDWNDAISFVVRIIVPKFRSIMKRPVLFILILLAACKPGGYIVSPNEVRKEKAILYLRNGEKINGEINIELESNSAQHTEFKPLVEILPEGKTVWQKINIVDIAAYSTDKDYYPAKNLDVDLNGTHFLMFVKRLTAEKSKIQLYELYESGRGTYTGEPKYSYFLSFPGYAPYQTINARSSQLIPGFDFKMSSMVEDCPILAKKIRSRQKDYFLSMTTFNRKMTPEVLMRIINEYDSCH